MEFALHVLKNPSVIQSIIEYAEIRPNDVVLEVCSSIGNITVRILEKATKVIVCEVDPRKVLEIQKRVMGVPIQAKLELLNCNVIPSDFPFFDLCIGNVPTKISLPLIQKLIHHLKEKPKFR